MARDNYKYSLPIENLPEAFAYHQVITDDDGKPVDYIFLQVNPAFEEMTGLKREEVIGKKVTEVLPGIEKGDFDWIDTYGQVVLSGKPARFESYSESLGRWYEVSVYSNKTGYVASYFHDITRLKQTAEEKRNHIKEIEEKNESLILKEKALRESEERLDLAMAVKNEGIWDWNLLTDETYFDERYYTMAGYKPYEFPQNFTSWAERVHKEDLPQAQKAISDYLDGQSSKFDIDFRFMKKDGQWMWINGKGKIYERDQNNKPIRMVGTHTDITERKIAEENLKKIEWMLSHKQTSASAEQTGSHDQGYGDLTELNRGGIILKYIGPELLRSLSSDYLELLGTSSAIYEVNGDYALGIFTSGWCQMLDKASRDLCDTPDNAKALSSGRWLCHESCWTDCSKEAIIRRQQADIECNGGIRLYAVPILANDEVVGAINFGYGDPPEDREKLQKLADTYQVNYHDLVRKANAYETRPLYIIEMAKKRLHVTAQLIGSMIEARQANEEIRSLNKELEQRVKERTVELEAINKELVSFAYSVSHDLRTPLRAIEGFSARLNEKYIDQLDEQGQHYLNRIRNNTSNMSKLIDDLLKLSRVSRTEINLQEVDLSHLAKECVKLLEEAEPERRVEIEVDPDLLTRGDQVLLRVMLENLLNNAWKFSSREAQAKIAVGRTIIDGEEVFYVRDNGVGFDMTYADKLFGTFQRLHAADEFCGTGIGLATVQRIINRHGGKIWAESEVDNGATFYFTLPV